MKYALAVLFCLCFTFLSFSQTVTENPKESDDAVYGVVENHPEFPGGMRAFYSFIGTHYRVPNVKGLKGKVFVQFVVEKDGSLGDIKVVKDLGYGTGEEAIRVLSLCPKWIPAKQKGLPVRVLYSLPIQIDTKK